jgi:hypothetical protein
LEPFCRGNAHQIDLQSLEREFAKTLRETDFGGTGHYDT